MQPAIGETVKEGKDSLLLVAATELEMAPVRRLVGDRPGVEVLVSGIGPLETAVNLTAVLARRARGGRLVLHFGVAGAYLDRGLGLLDLCLAEREVLGELGICYGSRLEPLGGELPVAATFDLDFDLRQRAASLLAAQGVTVHQGTFVTVSGVSGTESRGIMLRDTHGAICENMEGAAVARVCQYFSIPCLELRSISNMVVDRDPGQWRLAEAVKRCSQAVALLLDGLG